MLLVKNMNNIKVKILKNWISTIIYATAMPLTQSQRVNGYIIILKTLKNDNLLKLQSRVVNVELSSMKSYEYMPKRAHKSLI